MRLTVLTLLFVSMSTIQVFSQVATISIGVNFTNPTNCGGNDGSATASVTGGTPPYTYLWSDGQTTPEATGLIAGTYTVTVDDSRGYLISAQVTLTQPPLSPAIMTGIDPTTFGGNDGSAIASVNEGTPPYSYHWSDGQTTATAINLSAGTYSVIVTDANGCQASGEVTLLNPFNATTVVINHVLCYGDANGAAEAIPNNGTAPYTYLWSDGQTTKIASGLVAGEYSVTITDSDENSSMASVVILQPAMLSLNVYITNPSVQGGNDGSAEAVASGGTPPYTFLWTGPVTRTGPIATGLVAGDYVLQVTNANDCIIFTDVTLTEPEPFELILEIVPDSMTGQANPQGVGTYFRDDIIDISVQPVEGFTFIGWEAENPAYQQYIADPESLVTSFTMPPNHVTITATFSEIPPEQYSLTVNIEGQGEVVANGDSYYNTFTVMADEGIIFNLEAFPAEGWQFNGWSGDLEGYDNPLDLFMDGNKTVTATFVEILPKNYSLTVSNEGSGHVLVDGHTYTETLTFIDGTELLVKAIPEGDWVFKHWEGDINSNDSLINLLMDGDKELVAVFSEKPLYSVSFEIKDEVGEPILDAYINFNGVNYPPSMYIFGGLKQGNYPYIVLRSGYFNTQGAVQITNVDVTLAVVLNKDNTLVRDQETRSLKVYPNPAKDNVIIESEEPISQISILNVMGQLLHVEIINGEQLIHLSLPNLDNGLYILHVQGQESLNTKLLLIEK